MKKFIVVHKYKGRESIVPYKGKDLFASQDEAQAAALYHSRPKTQGVFEIIELTNDTSPQLPKYHEFAG